MFPQAALRQKELEQNLQWARENDETLKQIQESLANTDRHLTAYLADQIDAQQIPQEAQVAAAQRSLYNLYSHVTGTKAFVSQPRKTEFQMIS